MCQAKPHTMYHVMIVHSNCFCRQLNTLLLLPRGSQCHCVQYEIDHRDEATELRPPL
jgi:hypothetical protein